MSFRNLILISLLVLPMGCKKKEVREESQEVACFPETTNVIAGSAGTARVFALDPMASASTTNLLPTSPGLDQFASPVALEELSGYGVLHGKYVHVGSGVCEGDYTAFSPENNFTYHHGDYRFSDAMTYHYGTSYRKDIEQSGYLPTSGSIQMITTCTYDNAFYYREVFSGSEAVCLGISSDIADASYSDDASVSVHELQHATTVNNYSPMYDLNQFHFDEAGGLNEAISDFIALTFFEPMLPSTFDPKVFSRWALGSFYGSYSGMRGAHRCPTYDPSYPNCGTFGQFNSATNTVSYQYPDGMGWPYADNYSGPGKLLSIYDKYKGFEEIHNIGIVMEGALWDIYEGLKAYLPRGTAHRMTAQLAMEGLRQSPKPSLAHASPVTYRVFANALLTSADLLRWSATEKSVLQSTLTARGLIGGDQLPSSWAQRDPAQSESDYVRITDSPDKLKDWLAEMGGDSFLVKQNWNTGLNERLDPGETALIWFNLQNASATTAGGVEVEVELLDPEVSLLTDEYDVHYNMGAVSSRKAQIQYGKINGTAIVAALSQGSASFRVPTANTYFKTNPYFYRTHQTGIWIKVSPTAASGKQVTFRVRATPSNGATSTVDFPVTIR